jgi:hypothetical protein
MNVARQHTAKKSDRGARPKNNHEIIIIPCRIWGTGITGYADCGSNIDIMWFRDIPDDGTRLSVRPMRRPMSVHGFGPGVMLLERYINLDFFVGLMNTYIRSILRVLVSEKPLPFPGLVLGNQTLMRSGLGFRLNTDRAIMELPRFFSESEGVTIDFLDDKLTSTTAMLQAAKTKGHIPRPAQETWGFPGHPDIRELGFNLLRGLAGPPVVKVVDGRPVQFERTPEDQEAEYVWPVLPYAQCPEEVVQTYAMAVTDEHQASTSATTFRLSEGPVFTDDVMSRANWFEEFKE